jgi:RNA polymerase sigma factor (sigma-70 family)
MLAEDIAQETALIALERFAGRGLQEPEKLAAFLHQTARYLHIGHVRRAQRHTLLPGEALDEVPHAQDGPEDEACRREAAQALDALLASLRAPRDRDLLTRLLLCDQPKHEVCEALELSASHFDRVCHRAKTRAVRLARTAHAGVAAPLQDSRG